MLVGMQSAQFSLFLLFIGCTLKAQALFALWLARVTSTNRNLDVTLPSLLFVHNLAQSFALAPL